MMAATDGRKTRVNVYKVLFESMNLKARNARTGSEENHHVAAVTGPPAGCLLGRDLEGRGGGSS